jgi:tetratricopeptide (TPR) repeat protein
MEQEGWDLDHRVAWGRVRARLFGVDDMPLVAGRYRVLHRLGAGAMGVVYAAHDERLGRRVAIKVAVGPQAADQTQVSRTMREAQMLATLAHPNVVTVFDVGAHEGHLFVAMELVEGETLACWLAGGRRPLREVVARFGEAGRGLAAAHAAGLVHRDFKPENVLIGQDGRVRVSDFGLARLAAATEGGGAAEPLDRGSAASFAGTPFYAAPEQYRGGPVDQRTDQFSFCVALYTAITGQHPFASLGKGGMAVAIAAGRLPAPPRQRLPAWLWRALGRGMSFDPEGRYPTMQPLLRELGHDRARRRLQLGAVALGLVLAAGGAVAYRLLSDRRLLCAAGPSKWAEAWNPGRARAVERAFAATGKPYAPAAAAEVSRALAAFGRAWTAMHREACEATRRRGEQSEDLLERRMLCLDARLRDVRALGDRFAAADPEVVERAPRAVHQLGDLATCADAAALSSQVRPPRDPAERARVAALRGQLAEVKALGSAGRTTEGLARGRTLVAAAKETQYRPLQAEVLLEVGELEEQGGDARAADRMLDQAVWAAEASRYDELAARAWTRLMHVRGDALAHYDEGLALRPRVTAALERLGANDELQGLLHVASAQLLGGVSRYDEARKEAESGLKLLEHRFGPDDLQVADALDELGWLLVEAGQAAQGASRYARALAIKRKAFGDAHPAVARALASLANANFHQIDYPAAVAHYQEASAILARALPPGHPDLAKVAHNFSLVYEAMAQWEQARRLHQRAVEIGALAFGRDHPTYGAFLMGLGSSLGALGRHEEALAALREALAIFERKLGAEHIRVAACSLHLAEILLDLRRFDEARPYALRSVAIERKLIPGPTVESRYALLVLGLIELGRGARAQAVAPLERAYAVGPGGDPGQTAQVEFALARALPGEAQVRARALARSAQARMAQDDRLEEDRVAVARWLRAH